MVGDLIALGVGTPSSIEVLILFGLGSSTPPEPSDVEGDEVTTARGYMRLTVTTERAAVGRTTTTARGYPRLTVTTKRAER